MPLSEHEQRLLDQIERALYQEDPKFASTVRSTDLRTHMRRRLRRAGVVFALGFVVMFAGVPTGMPVFGIVGFVIMLGALLIAMTAWKRLSPTTVPDLGIVGEDEQGRSIVARPARERRAKGSKERGRPARSKGPRSSGSPIERLEERWKRRWDERGR